MPIVPHASAGTPNPALRHRAPRDWIAVARRGSPQDGGASWLSARAAWIMMAACLVLGAIATPRAFAGPVDPPYAQAREIEGHLLADPKRAQEELFALLARADASPPIERRHVYALYGQAIAAAGKHADALALADRLEREAGRTSDKALLATARLVRSAAEWLAGDAGRANALAREARTLISDTHDPNLAYWAALSVGISARSRGRLEESLGALQDALSLAEHEDNAFRRSSAHYQLSTLYLMLKQPQSALEASLLAYQFGEAAGSPWAMARARMGESAAWEILEEPARELSAMEDALAIARKAKSDTSESLALINLADIKLRRKEFGEALSLSRRSLTLAVDYNDVALIATNKANLGFALFGLGRASEGKRFADEALAQYERTGATAEIASLLGEYGHYLEKAGDYKTALAFYHRERKLYEQMAAAAHQRSVLEIQEKYESDKRRREIELLNRQNALNSAELENQALRERVWWLFAAIFLIALAVTGIYYRRLRVNNGLLAQKNRELSVRSSRDPLTALYNRRYFQEFMRDTPPRPERRHRGPDKPIQALLLIDIDLFKQTNDRYGHAAGDAVLVVVARRLRDTLRETDMIVRWGGEEFLVFVPATSADKLDEIAARIMAAIAKESIEYKGNPIRVTTSIGYAPMPLPPEDVELPWERAVGLVDMALYMAKLHGRNCAYGIRRLRRSDDEAMSRIERNLESAWANGMVEMHLEPGPAIDAGGDDGVEVAASPPATVVQDEPVSDLARRVA